MISFEDHIKLITKVCRECLAADVSLMGEQFTALEDKVNNLEARMDDLENVLSHLQAGDVFEHITGEWYIPGVAKIETYKDNK